MYDYLPLVKIFPGLRTGIDGPFIDYMYMCIDLWWFTDLKYVQ